METLIKFIMYLAPLAGLAIIIIILQEIYENFRKRNKDY